MTAYVDNFVSEGNLKHTTWTPVMTTVPTSATTITMDNTSSETQVFTGSTAGLTMKLPDCTTLKPGDVATAIVGWTFDFINDASVSVAVQYNDTTALFTLPAGSRARIKCTNIATAKGEWTYNIQEKSALKHKAGIVSSGSFSGTPKKATVTFTTAFPSSTYSVVVTGSDARFYMIESQSAGSFVINTNANQALTGNVFWEAVGTGES